MSALSMNNWLKFTSCVIVVDTFQKRKHITREYNDDTTEDVE